MVMVIVSVSKLFYCFLFCLFGFLVCLFCFLFFVWLPYLYPFRYTHLVSLCRCVAALSVQIKHTVHREGWKGWLGLTDTDIDGSNPRSLIIVLCVV